MWNACLRTSRKPWNEVSGTLGLTRGPRLNMNRIPYYSPRSAYSICRIAIPSAVVFLSSSSTASIRSPHPPLLLADGVPPAVSPRVSRGVRCTPHGIPEYDIANDGFPAESAPPRPPRRPTRTPPHQRGSTTSQTRRQTQRSAVHNYPGELGCSISHTLIPSRAGYGGYGVRKRVCTRVWCKAYPPL